MTGTEWVALQRVAIWLLAPIISWLAVAYMVLVLLSAVGIGVIWASQWISRD